MTIDEKRNIAISAVWHYLTKELETPVEELNLDSLWQGLAHLNHVSPQLVASSFYRYAGEQSKRQAQLLERDWHKKIKTHLQRKEIRNRYGRF